MHDGFDRNQSEASNMMSSRYSRYPPLPKLRRAVRPQDIRNCTTNPIPYHQRNNIDSFDPETFPLDNPSLQRISDSSRSYRSGCPRQESLSSNRQVVVTVRNASTSTPPDLTLFPGAATS